MTMTIPDDAILRMLDKLGSAAVLISQRGQVMACNESAARLIYEDDAVGFQPGADLFTHRTIQSALTDMFGTVELDQPSRDRRLAFQALDIVTVDEARRVMILIDLSVRSHACAPALEKIFGLTVAEGRLAAELSNGVPLATIARTRGVSIATLRSQLASIFAKTGTARQPELVALLSRIYQFSPSQGVVN